MVRRINPRASSASQAQRSQTKRGSTSHAGFKKQLRSRTEVRPNKMKLRLKHAQRLAKFAPMIARAAQKYDVPIDLICGVMLQESGGNPKAKSHCGATGLMQLMPATAKRMGVQNIWDPAQNIDGGTKYLGYLLKLFDGNLVKAVAGYNAGEGAVQKYGGVPPYKETQNYVPCVLGYTAEIGKVLGRANQQRQAMQAMIRRSQPHHGVMAQEIRQPKAPTPSPTVDPSAMARRMARI